jgi:hypothetical protein
MITVSNTNSSGKNKTAVRVYKNNILVGEVFPTARNPLAYLRAHQKSKYNTELFNQLKSAGFTQEEIESVYK